MEEFRACLNLGNLSQGGDYWKVSQIVFLSQLKVIDSFLIEDVFVSRFPINIKEISYYHIFF